MRRHAGARARIWRDGGATRARTMSSASTFAGSTGATATCRRLRMSGTIEEPLGRNVTVAPPAPLSATASKALIRRSWETPATQPTRSSPRPVPRTGRSLEPSAPYDRRVTITYEWRGDFDNTALNALHADGFGPPVARHRLAGTTRTAQPRLGLRVGGRRLIGFVNVVWDGGVHAFVLDTVVARHRRGGGRRRAGRSAPHEARAAQCEWLHVDFEEHLRPFYIDACGFKETAAGLIAL